MSKGVSDDQVEGVLLNSQTRASFALLAVMSCSSQCPTFMPSPASSKVSLSSW